MPNRTIQSNEYRYGFNGKEKDENGEWGSQTNYDYGFRIYNPGIAKFLSVDPMTYSYPYYTPYQFAGNNPIRYIDLDGAEKAEPAEFQAAEAILDKKEQEVKNDPSKDKTKVKGMTMTDAINQLRSQLKNPNSPKTNYLGYYCGKSACQNVMLNYDPPLVEVFRRVCWLKFPTIAVRLRKHKGQKYA